MRKKPTGGKAYVPTGAGKGWAKGKKRCTAKDCMRPATVKGMCQRCYERKKREATGVTRRPRQYGEVHQALLEAAVAQPGISVDLASKKLSFRGSIYTYVAELRDRGLLEPADRRYHGRLFPTAAGYRAIREKERSKAVRTSR